ncbi:MAG: homocysteine S-methyltransferase family protein [Casimicrobiaceae bacterium]
MSKYRHGLPQLGPAVFLTDGGLETTLLFHDGVDLPYFAAFDLLKSDDGRATLRRYFERYSGIAKARGMGLVLETPTWRANPDWGAKLGYDASALAAVNRQAVDLLLDVRRDHESAATPIVISGNLGPRGDGYVAGKRMSADEAADYHDPQVATFAQTDADMVAAFTMNYVEEAVGAVRAAQSHAMPVAISFTVETDGRLPSGMPLAEAIDATDRATGGPAYYMINCAHPTHFERVVRDDARLRERVRGLRANASRRSHAELDESADLDEGNPVELAAQYRALRAHLPNLTIVGGCCGTDHRHVDAIGAALV